MADLDDFFAKKDKKKGKTKKYLSSEELVKQLEQAALQTVKETEPSKKPAKIEEESETTNNENDDEWKEFEEEKHPDLSNLKLGQLNINDTNETNQNYSGGNDYENDNSNNEGDSSENPWSKANSTQGEAKPLPDPVKQTKPSGAYIPPGVARAENLAKTRFSRKNAPDLKNEESFPELGTAKAPEPVRSNKKDGFEEVKHGGKNQSTVAGPGSVSLGNAYSTLGSLDS